MDVRHLEYFVAVVDHGGVNRAAEHMHVAQPSVSQAIRQLERELKVELFHRTGRNLILNPAGELLLAPARQVLAELLAIRDLMRGVRDLQVGSVTIGTMPEMPSEAVAAWSGPFTRSHPGIRMDLLEFGDADELCDAVLAGRCELGFTTFPVPADALERIDFGTQSLLLVMPPGSTVELVDGAVPLARIPEIPLVTSTSSELEAEFVAAAERLGRTPPRVAARVPNRHAQVTLVLNGTASAFLPVRMAVTAHRMGAVVVETAPEVRAPFGVVHRAGALSPAARGFVTLSRASLVRWQQRVAALRAGGAGLLDAALAADAEERGGQSSGGAGAGGAGADGDVARDR